MVLVAGFETIFALHVNVERVGRFTVERVELQRLFLPPHGRLPPCHELPCGGSSAPLPTRRA